MTHKQDRNTYVRNGIALVTSLMLGRREVSPTKSSGGYLHKIFFLFSVFVAVILLGCAREVQLDSSTVGAEIVPCSIVPETAETSAGISPAVRDLTVDSEGNVYVFDYAEYKIKKFDANGRLLCEFGGQGESPGQFTHLTGIKTVGNRILALDAAAINFFSTEGDFLERRPFPQKVLTNFPALFDNGRYVGFQIVAEELKAVLTVRSARGQEENRLAFHDIREFFPDVEPGEDFFLNDTHTRIYLYAVDRNQSIIWAASDALKIYRYRHGSSELIVREKLSRVPFPEEDRQVLEARKSRLPPSLFLYVPESYQLIYHLLTGNDGDIWVYVKSVERSGFVHYSATGDFLGYHPIQADFDLTAPDTVVRIFNERFYFLVNARRQPSRLLTAEMPGRPS